ncbi:MoaD/ThiS family protein [Microbacterium sp.]|uniref:MoaD/ThiS family protein n=1 Tax=Microbacterium sp. TaxID=51671 RepID=UPI0039E3C619
MARVRLFAAAEDAVGADTLTRDETTLGALRAALTAEFPDLDGLLPRCAVLVGGARVDDDTPLGVDDVVDVLPPFAGG